jgi:hypothetical protein
LLMDPSVTDPRQHKEACKWCWKTSHNTTECSMIHKCLLCQSWEHLERDCKIPHRLCWGNTTCQVPKDHWLYCNQSCPGLAYETWVYNALPTTSVID